MSEKEAVKKYFPSTNYCMIDEAGSREPFGGSKFILADDYDTLEGERDRWHRAAMKAMGDPDKARVVYEMEAQNKRLRGFLGSLRAQVRPHGSGALDFDCRPHMIMDRDTLLLRDIDAELEDK